MQSFFCVCCRILFVFLLSHLVAFPSARAADVSLGLTVHSVDNQVTVVVENHGETTLPPPVVDVELAAKHYRAEFHSPILAHRSQSLVLQAEPPNIAGTYPLITTLSYKNEATSLSLVDVGYFNVHVSEQQRIQTRCEIPKLFFRKEKTFAINCSGEAPQLRIALPKEIQLLKIQRDEQNPNGSRWTIQIENSYTGLNNSYDFYGILEDTSDPALHRTEIIRSRMSTRRVPENHVPLRPLDTAFIGCLGFCLMYVCYKRFYRPETTTKIPTWAPAAVRFFLSVFIVSFLFLAFQSMSALPDLLLGRNELPLFKIPLGGSSIFLMLNRILLWLNRASTTLLEWMYFDGKNYEYFSEYVVLPLYLYMLSANYFVLRYLIRPEPRNDKYWHLLRTFISLTPGGKKILGGEVPAEENLKDGHIFFSKKTKVAILTLCVKVFYVPLLSSWCINNCVHMNEMVANFKPSFVYINQFLVDLFIFVDVLFFAIGYVVELPQLKNQIRSVEPTLLGWTVCLMCYPPFNLFAFDAFDWNWHDRWVLTGQFQNQCATVAITLLWGIYTWATVALGFRSSNLTNRGIVSTGPYRYVRHPAYVSKVSLWMVEAFFWGRHSFFLSLSFVIVYSLRAWTEERHLARDSEYLEYRKQVRWWLVPKIF